MYVILYQSYFLFLFLCPLNQLGTVQSQMRGRWFCLHQSYMVVWFVVVYHREYCMVVRNNR